MSQNIHMCDVPEKVKAILKGFRLKKVDQCAALIVKIDPETMAVEVESECEGKDIECLAEDLPERQPRFVLMVIKHPRDNGRITYPLVCIFFSPDGARTDLQMMYTNTLSQIVEFGGITKVFKVREVEELTCEWMSEQLEFFK